MATVLTDALGEQGAQQLRETVRGLRRLAQNWYMAAIGLLFLLFVATTLFKVIRNSLNDIWDIRLERSGFVYDMKGRAKSLIIIVSAALLFIAAGIIDLVTVFAGQYINNVSEKGGQFFTSALNEIISVAVVTVWFMVLFRFLANARPSWHTTAVGGFLTSILFLIGKSVLSTVIINANAGAVYGAGGAIVLILLFVFYSSFILYFGGCFIKEYAELTQDPILPSRRAYVYEIQKVNEE